MAEEQRGRSQALSIAAIVGLVVIILAAVAGTVIVMQSAKPRPVPIGEVLGDLRHYDGQVVTVKGRVTQTLNIQLLKVFYLTDDTGEITVVTDRGLPNKGEEISVTGVVNEVFALLGKNMVVIKEFKPEEGENGAQAGTVRERIRERRGESTGA